MIFDQHVEEHGLLHGGVLVTIGNAFQSIDIGILQCRGVYKGPQLLHTSAVYMGTHCCVLSAGMITGKLLQFAELP